MTNLHRGKVHLNTSTSGNEGDGTIIFRNNGGSDGRDGVTLVTKEGQTKAEAHTDQLFRPVFFDFTSSRRHVRHVTTPGTFVRRCLDRPPSMRKFIPAM
jgi:hypothetical protein